MGTFLYENWLNIALVLVGATGLVVYLLQQKHKRCAAATKVVLQIDQIEATVNELKGYETLNNEIVYKAKRILDYNSWKEDGYLFYQYLDYDDINLIESFFACAEELEKSRCAICRAMENAWEHKDRVFQNTVGEYARNKETFAQNCAEFRKALDFYAEIFTPGLPISILMQNLKNFRNLSGTTAYKRLKKLSYKK